MAHDGQQPARTLLHDYRSGPETPRQRDRRVRPHDPRHPARDADGLKGAAMQLWFRILWKLRYGWRREQLDRELDEEMRFHLDMLEDERSDRGDARRDFGNTVALHEDSRTAWGW